MFDNLNNKKYLEKNEESSMKTFKKENLRDVQLKVRLTREEMDKLETLANNKGLTKSFLIQRYIRNLK
jgi:predicted DNA-binding protein